MPLDNNTGQRWVYASVVEGKFVVKRGDELDKFTAAEGALESLSTYLDAAPGFEPTMRLEVVLKDGDDTMLCVRGGMHTAYGRMFAAQVGSFAKGDPLRMELNSGTDNSKVSTCFLRKRAVDEETGEATWVKASYEKVVGESTAEANEKAEAVVKGHAAYKVHERRAKDAHDGDGAGHEKERFLQAAKAAGLPDFNLYQGHWLKFFNRVRAKTGASTLASAASMTDSDFTAFADWLQSKGDSLKDPSAWPAELKEAEDYDPFA